MSEKRPPFRVAFTADLYAADGSCPYKDIGLDVLRSHSHILYRGFPEHRQHLDPDQIADANALIVLTPRVTAKTLSHSRDLCAVIRYGVGYDSVDVPACTAAEVLAIIATSAVDRSVGEATVAWMLALTHKVLVKDRLLRECRWNERTKYMGSELRDRVFGAVGLGGIARATISLLRGFGMKPPIAFDPYVKEAAARDLGVRLVSLDDLLRTADFVSIHCPLNDETRNLIGARELALMKPDAYLINTARGGIVDETALYEVLKTRRIRGAAIDVFAEEPVLKPHPFAEVEDAILAPHSVAWTDEIFRDIGRVVCQAAVDLSLGKRPRGVLNPGLFEDPSFERKWARLRGEGW